MKESLDATRPHLEELVGLAQKMKTVVKDFETRPFVSTVTFLSFSAKEIVEWIQLRPVLEDDDSLSRPKDLAALAGTLAPMDVVLGPLD
jgi:hypothetical protein